MPIVLVVVLTCSVTTLIGIIVFYFQHKQYVERSNQEKKSFEIARKINGFLLRTSDYKLVLQEIANFLPSELHFATGVVALYDENKKVLQRVAASDTKEAQQAIQALSVPFNKIAIPVSDQRNLMSRSLMEHKEFVTDNSHDVFVPALSQEESTKIQQIMSTKSTIVYPLYVENKPLGVFIASSNKKMDEITDYEKDIISVFVNGAGIALQNAQLFASIKNANDELKKLNEMKDEFVFIATHDLQTPVTAIDGYISLIEKEKPDFSNDIKENFEEVKSASGRLKQLVNDLLQVARGESGTIKIDATNVDLNQIINNVVREVQPSADAKKVKIILQLDETNKQILGDEFKLPEVIENLLSNAIKFNRPDGNITITTKKLGAMIEVTVSDTGYGIPEAEQTKVFEKFFKYRGAETRDVPGTGLGLFVIRMLIEKMGGKITFNSIEGKGTSFVFTLPTAPLV